MSRFQASENELKTGEDFMARSTTGNSTSIPSSIITHLGMPLVNLADIREQQPPFDRHLADAVP